MLMTVARENDPFVCENFIAIEGANVKAVKRFIKENIHGKSDEDIYEVYIKSSLLNFYFANFAKF